MSQRTCLLGVDIGTSACKLVVFSQEGKRSERVVHAPVQTLQNLILTPEDEQDLRSVQPFVLTTKDIVYRC